MVPMQLRQREAETQLARISGTRRDDEWLRYIRGQALFVVEAAREYAAGERVTVHLY